MNINWKKKLTSRKFWMAVVGLVTPLLLTFGVSEDTATQIAGIIMSGAACISYIIGEGMVDAEYTADKLFGNSYDNTGDGSDEE